MRRSVVVTSRDLLSPAAISEIGRRLLDWEANGGGPLVVDGGMKVSTLGSMTLVLVLGEGPLAGARISLTIDALDDLPESLDFANGRYIPERTDDGWVHWTDGSLSYTWVDG